MSTYLVEKEQIIGTGLYTYNRAVIYNIINIYAIRMAGVFMISIGTIWIRTGSMHRGWSFLTYALALMLLLSIQNFQWISLVFPVWVFAVSVYILIQNLHNKPQPFLVMINPTLMFYEEAHYRYHMRKNRKRGEPPPAIPWTALSEFLVHPTDNVVGSMVLVGVMVRIDNDPQ